MRLQPTHLLMQSFILPTERKLLFLVIAPLRQGIPVPKALGGEGPLNLCFLTKLDLTMNLDHQILNLEQNVYFENIF